MKKGILTFYVDVGQLPTQRAIDYVDRVKEQLKENLKEIKECGYIILFFPVRPGGEGRIECIEFDNKPTKLEKLEDMKMQMLLSNPGLLPGSEILSVMNPEPLPKFNGKFQEATDVKSEKTKMQKLEELKFQVMAQNPHACFGVPFPERKKKTKK